MEGYKLKKLPAFLKGPAAAHFHGLVAEQKASYATLSAHLQKALCPVVNRELFYAEFDCRKLRPTEDPNLLLWDLEDLLRNAEPDLSDDARAALLARQFMKSLPHDIRLRLLEGNPTPSVQDMRVFVERYRVVHHFRWDESPVLSISAVPNAAPPDDFRDAITSLTAAIANLTKNQETLQAAVSQQQQQPRPQNATPRSRWPSQDTSNSRAPRRSFNCNQSSPPLDPVDLNCVGVTGQPLPVDGSAQFNLSFASVHQHSYSEAEARRRKWINFVKTEGAKWEASKSSVICSEHFVNTDFKSITGLSTQIKRCLITDEIGIVSVPSVYPKNVEDQGSAAAVSSKRDRKMMLMRSTSMSKETTAEENFDEVHDDGITEQQPDDITLVTLNSTVS
eukprot:gene20724-biopygen17106